MKLVATFSPTYGISQCLRLLGLPRSSWYARSKKQTDIRQKYQHLKPTLAKIIKAFPGYGYRRINAELHKQYQITINHKLLKKLLRVWGWSLKRHIKHPKPSGITKLLKTIGPSVNLIRLIANPQPFQVLVSDMTEIIYQGGKAYLAVFLDLVSKRIVGHAVSEHPDVKLILAAYSRAKVDLQNRQVNMSSIFYHQDQGSVYTSYEYVATTLADGITLSYSRVGSPQDNPACESFFGRWKAEYYQLINQAKTSWQVEHLIDETIDEYNTVRRHSSLNYQSPEQYIAQLLTTNHPSAITQMVMVNE